MKQLIILRHAKAAPQDQAGDYKRPLTEKGQAAAALVGQHLRQMNINPEVVLVSAAHRTRETYAIVAEAAGLNPAEFEDDLYLASANVVLRRLKKIPPRANSVLLLGHNPALAELVSRLPDPDESDPALMARARQKFPPGSCAILEVLTPWSEIQDGDCALKAFFTPSELGGGADEE